MIKALIIDDEKLARDIIRNYLKLHPDIELIGECGDGFEGVKAINEHQPELIFLDVQMPKLTGFEMLELVDKIPVIIFSTAYDEFALKAFEMSAADYLLKPFTAMRFNEALTKARARLMRVNGDEEIVRQIQDTQEVWKEELSRIVVRYGSKIVIIPAQKIDYIEAQDDYVAVYSEGKKHLKQLTMKYLEASLPQHQFVRVHRSFIVATDGIDRLEALSKDSFIAILKSGDSIPVSRKGYGALREVLKF